MMPVWSFTIRRQNMDDEQLETAKKVQPKSWTPNSSKANNHLPGC